MAADRARLRGRDSNPDYLIQDAILDYNTQLDAQILALGNGTTTACQS